MSGDQIGGIARRTSGILTFHQANVAKGGPNMDIALQQAWEAGADIVMIQEP